VHFDGKRQFNRDGFVIIEHLFSTDDLQKFRAALAELPQDRANVRNVLAVCPRLGDLLRSDGVFALAEEILGTEPVLTRAILFDKRPGANWAVGWHQDVTIAVACKLDVPGFSAWSVKEGVAHVQPPTHILERLLTIRFHLDDCLDDNGPLQVLPGSHGHGRLSDEEIIKWSQRESVTCTMAGGSALVMRPLLLHRSSAAQIPSHRRVLHLEFAGEKLPGGLEWNVSLDTAR